jgi:mono/diheme cytochrome c family protein
MPQTSKQARPREGLVKWLLLLVSLATTVVLIGAALRENRFADWKQYRLEYAGILEKKAGDDRGVEIARQFDPNMEQYFLTGLDRVDRCTTCHAGLEDPRMTDQPEPFTTHPGRYLEFHDPARFGCTICHDGQGRATETADAHGTVPFWDHPLLEGKYAKTACSRCHSEEDLFGESALLARADDIDKTGDSGSAAGDGHSSGDGHSPVAGELLTLGRDLFQKRGCLGCHALNGKGGTFSVDITFEGDKTHHEFDFSHFAKEEPREPAYWHRKHFRKPLVVAPGTVMPATGKADEADALTAYMLNLRSGAPAAYRKKSSHETGAPAAGEELYAMYCSSCHGAEGLETEAPGISTPALNNSDSLAVADNDYYRFIIANGRSGSKMTPWKEGHGNLTRAEIDRIVGTIRKWEPAGAEVGDVNARLGDKRNGRAYYQGLCANCHGRRGEGGIGNILNSTGFLAVASDPFLAETIIQGRPGTAMPSWKHFDAQGISDILAYLRSWQPDSPTWEEVQASMQSVPAGENARIGRHIYQANCSGCHGRNGEGGIGLNLNSPDILRVVDDEFLFRTIAFGRPTTAMPSWRHLSADDTGALIAAIRSWQKDADRELKPAPRPGDYAVGKIHFETSCLRCHGENGRGGIGPQLANPILLSSASDAVLNHWIGKGRTGTAMVSFLSGEQGITRLDSGQIADIIAYLRREGRAAERPLLRTGVGNPLLGSQLFLGNCVSCHGRQGEGASGPQLNNPSFLHSASDGFLAATMVLGRSGTAMQSMIHGQEGLGQIAPDQVQDIIAHMRLWDVPATWRKPRVMAEMSERAIQAGGESFTQYCSSCHGTRGRGVLDGADYFAPSLNNPEFLEAASDGFLLATIARGRSGTPMRPFGLGSGGIASLPSDHISDIVSFIRTWQERKPSINEQKTSEGGRTP